MDFLKGKASERKLRLYACACCRHIWDLLLDERSRQAIDVAEQYADGLISEENLSIIHDGSLSARRNIKKTFGGYSPIFNAARAADAIVGVSIESVLAAAGWVASALANQAVPDPASGDFDDAHEAVWYFKMVQACPSLRDIFGNPFRPVTINPAWLTPKVTTLAQTIYNDRAFDRMPELADALQEAGCDNQDMLSHCRGPGPHVKGCWVVDLLLGKE